MSNVRKARMQLFLCQSILPATRRSCKIPSSTVILRNTTGAQCESSLDDQALQDRRPTSYENFVLHDERSREKNNLARFPVDSDGLDRPNRRPMVSFKQDRPPMSESILPTACLLSHHASTNLLCRR